MVYLYDKASGALLGELSEAQLQFMIDQLEEESLEDRDYSITRMTIDYFEAQGGDPRLISLLRKALGNREEVIVRWSRQMRPG